jgi:hypothetical protein
LAGKIQHAYFEVHFPYIVNTSVNENYLHWTDEWIEAGDLTHWYNAIYTTVGNLHIAPSAIFTGDIRLAGNFDLATFVNSRSGDYVYFRWVDVASQEDSMIFRDAYIVTRVYVSA